jgi:hypothetical protein
MAECVRGDMIPFSGLFRGRERLHSLTAAACATRRHAARLPAIITTRFSHGRGRVRPRRAVHEQHCFFLG